MKSNLLILVLGVIGVMAYAVPAYAEVADPVDVKLNALSSATDASLRELTDKAKKADDQFQAMQGYASGLEKRLGHIERFLNTYQDSFAFQFKKMQARVDKLERIVSGRDGKGGLQHQVTVLHSKKADK